MKNKNRLLIVFWLLVQECLEELKNLCLFSVVVLLVLKSGFFLTFCVFGSNIWQQGDLTELLWCGCRIAVTSFHDLPAQSLACTHACVVCRVAESRQHQWECLGWVFVWLAGCSRRERVCERHRDRHRSSLHHHLPPKPWWEWWQWIQIFFLCTCPQTLCSFLFVVGHVQLTWTLVFIHSPFIVLWVVHHVVSVVHFAPNSLLFTFAYVFYCQVFMLFCSFICEVTLQWNSMKNVEAVS